jgi:signal recognition particle-docking protein FtsY
VDSEHLSHTDEALHVDDIDDPGRVRSFVNCGTPLPGYEVEVRDSEGRPLPEPEVELEPLAGEEIAYIQYTSGSTRFPRGVLIIIMLLALILMLFILFAGPTGDILRGIDAPQAVAEPGRPLVILMVGINGAGKTTTIGKLARLYQDAGHSVMLAAGDTFRAAAVEQLQTWGERNDIPVIAQASGSDAASVIYDALDAATARKIDVLIADTAGRLHTKGNLMDELAKISRVLKKIDPAAPHEVMLVVDAGTGQNALNQPVQFHDTVGLTGITLTKLDGTAKGGIIFAIADRLGVPIRYVGIGEGIQDLRPFDADEFVKALFE